MGAIVLRSFDFWRQVAALLLAVVATSRAVLGLASPVAVWQYLLVVGLVLLTLIALRAAYRDDLKRSPIVSAAPIKLVDQNERWLSEQGRAVIVTRDMSWAMSPRLRQLLLTKSSSGELAIVVHRMTDFLDELLKEGADVRVLKEPPSIRFTALRYGTADCRFLVHRQDKGKVKFWEYSASSFPEYWICQDLVRQYLSTSD